MRDKIAGTGLASIFVLFALVLLFIERAPPIVAILAVVVAACASDISRVRGTLRSNPALWFAGVFVGWMLLSMAWSIAGDEALSNGPRIAVMIAVAVMLPVLCLAQPDDVKARARRWAVIAGCLAVTLLLIETLLDMPLLRTSRYLFNNEVFTDTPPPAGQGLEGVAYHPNFYLANRLSHLASIVAIMLVPVAAYMFQRGSYSGALAILVAGMAALVLAPTHTPFLAVALALATGLMFMAIRAFQSDRSGLVLATLVAGAVIAAPWFAAILFGALQGELAGADVSILHRLAIWDYTAGLIAERPVMGSGIEAARVIGRDGVDFGQLVPGHPLVFEALPLHPHNASIQIWLELGGIGALIFALFLFALTRQVAKYAGNNIARAGLLAGWLAGITIAHLSYGIWQYWWIASLGLVVAMVALMFEPARDE